MVLVFYSFKMNTLGILDHFLDNNHPTHFSMSPWALEAFSFKIVMTLRTIVTVISCSSWCAEHSEEEKGSVFNNSLQLETVEKVGNMQPA